MASATTVERSPGRFELLAYKRHAAMHRLAYPKGPPVDAKAARKTKHPKGYWFDESAAQHPIQFIEGYCKHHKGQWAGQPLLLEEWERFIEREIFGWKRADGSRLFRIAYVEVPRKNGKSELGAGTGLYLTVGDREPGAEVYSTATKKDQAKIVHDAAREMVKASPRLRRQIRIYRNRLHVARLGAKFEPLSSDSNTLDGLNPHGNVIDEVHAHKNRGLWDVMDTAMGARRQPLTFAITTAGVYEPESIGWQQHDHAIKVLEGSVEDDAFFAFIAAADPEDDWTQPETWARANPNVGVSVSLEYLAGQCEKAKQQPSFLNTFLRLHLNRWTQQADRWIPIERWNECDGNRSQQEQQARAAELEGEACYGGLDLSTKLDITALVLVFQRESGVIELLPRFWVPEATVQLRSKRDRVPYDAWVRDGWMMATPGDVVDYDFIRTDVGELGERFRIQEIGFDPWNATQIAVQLGNDGFQMVEVRQGPRSLSEPCKEFEKLIIAKKVRHGGNPVLRWMVSNVSLRKDVNDNIAPDKSTSVGRIDGVVGTVIAMSRMMLNPEMADPQIMWIN